MSDRPTQRGVVFPSPVVVLSIVAVAMAAIAFFVTRGVEPDERDVATTVQSTPSETPSAEPSRKPGREKPKPKPIERDRVFVEVYNNSGITGLAGSVGTQATDAGWKVVGTDNWYGTVSGNTVFFPERLERAAKQLALDLGIQRTAPAVGQMRLDRLTIVLTSPL
ncbi:LytR family transcriptional regulator [Nocardioides dongxiaopingii]|uniref:LytR C-terminal domain-containing protein n=1 Tax=Nocardioides TaxID=1839 RepID=UPI0010C76B3C|nr:MULTISPECIES: LytR C-terminal domain-containing protein [Nocardioides]QCW51779.1 LytR family transcriptional regulator [Nocardioides sp. S-1144]